MDKRTKLDTLPEKINEKGKQVFLNKNNLVGDNPNKMVIGSGTSLGVLILILTILKYTEKLKPVFTQKLFT